MRAIQPTPHEDHHEGLAQDLPALLRLQQRRRALGWLAGAGSLALLGCGGGGDEGSSSSSSSSSGSSSSGSSGSSSSGSSSSGGTSTSSCSVIPEETAGPYPGDGSNSNGSGLTNALALAGIVRSDIRSSVAGVSGTAEGVPLSLSIRLLNTNGSCANLAGYAIYLWHCTCDGLYSLYSSGITQQNYLRGVQETNSEGIATFTTIFPGCYAGRMPHMHFEVYRSLASASSYTSKLRTSQIAFPTEVCNTVYAGATGYSESARNFGQISFSSDNVFSDGVTLQMASVSGSIAAGYTASLNVAIAA